MISYIVFHNNNNNNVQRYAQKKNRLELFFWISPGSYTRRREKVGKNFSHGAKMLRTCYITNDMYKYDTSFFFLFFKLLWAF